MDDVIVPRERLLRHLCRKSKPLRGDRYLLELLTHPNQPIHSSQLKNLFNEQGRGKQEFEDMANFKAGTGINLGYGWCELPIEMTDMRTLTECWIKLRQLAEQEAILEDWNDLARLDEIRDEKQQILDFVRSCVNKNGKIKCLRNKQYDDYRAVLKTLNRTKAEIAKLDPELLAYIEEHLVIGVYCQWKEAM